MSVGTSSIKQLSGSLDAASVVLDRDEIAATDATPLAKRYPEWFAYMMLDDTHAKALT